MRRLGKVCVHVPCWRYDTLPDSCKGYYNHQVETNKTVKMPYYCPNGKSNCLMCSQYQRSGKYKRKQRKHDMNNLSKQMDFTNIM
jgi:hypothetical protein